MGIPQRCCVYGAAITYHQLDTVAREQRNFAAAEACYKKALKVEEEQENEHSMAITYCHLGIIAQEQRDFATAEAWCKKALMIYKKQKDVHGAANAYYQLGRIAEEQRDIPQAGDFYLISIKMFANTNDTYSLKTTICSYAHLLHTAKGTERSQLKLAWSTNMPQELTEILEEMEIEQNHADS